MSATLADEAEADDGPEGADGAGAVAAARQLLRLIANDPLMRGSYRIAARRHLASLQGAEPVSAAAGDWGLQYGPKRRVAEADDGEE